MNIEKFLTIGKQLDALKFGHVPIGTKSDAIIPICVQFVICPIFLISTSVINKLKRLKERIIVKQKIFNDELSIQHFFRTAQQDHRSRQSRQRFIEQSFIPRVRQEITRTANRRRRTTVDITHQIL